MRYRTLSRRSAHRRALLRNLVTSLFEHESITTTWPKGPREGASFNMPVLGS